jgi:hypothetical protein
MFRHFQKLYKYGRETYLPINRLDVMTSKDPVWDPKFTVADAAAIEEPVSLEFRIGDSTAVVRGVSTEMSEYGFLARLSRQVLKLRGGGPPPGGADQASSGGLPQRPEEGEPPDEERRRTGREAGR